GQKWQKLVNGAVWIGRPGEANSREVSIGEGSPFLLRASVPNPLYRHPPRFVPEEPLGVKPWRRGTLDMKL
ncbi:MAG: hypothetical protein KJN92_12965, partial [Gemmatimonadetes bacterium]|nr:hypothetical protein [Gemmatimonadota bacterium]